MNYEQNTNTYISEGPVFHHTAVQPIVDIFSTLNELTQFPRQMRLLRESYNLETQTERRIYPVKRDPKTGIYVCEEKNDGVTGEPFEYTIGNSSLEFDEMTFFQLQRLPNEKWLANGVFFKTTDGVRRVEYEFPAEELIESATITAQRYMQLLHE